MVLLKKTLIKNTKKSPLRRFLCGFRREGFYINHLRNIPFDQQKIVWTQSDLQTGF
jgi:hypothetical protein